MPKMSLYNHFQARPDGTYIAYNANTGAVALMTADNYASYVRLTELLTPDNPPDLPEPESQLLSQLQFGGFVCGDELDERQTIRFRHNLARYDVSALGLVIAPTMACNMACEYCFEENKTGRMSPRVIEALVEFVEKRAKWLKELRVSWYGGEPLLAMDIIEDLTATFMDLAGEHDFEYAASMVSNGYLLTPSNVDRLRALGVRDVQVTLDGPARIHNTKRPLKNGRQSFETILENMVHATTQLAVGVRVNIDKSFTTEIVAELLKELKEADLHQRVGVYFGRLEAAAKVCSNISEACHGTLDFSQVETGYYRLLLESGFRVDKLPAPVNTFCMAQKVASFLVDPQGYLYRCYNHVGDVSKSMGFIREEPDFQHPNFVRLFRFDPFEDASCRDCNLLPICMGGCPARRADQDFDGEDICESWKYNLEPMLEIIATSRQRPIPQNVKE